MALLIEVRALGADGLANLAGAGNLPCGWEGCDRNALWEVTEKDFLTREVAFPEFSRPFRNNVRPDSEIWSSEFVRYYCDQHARQRCLEGKLKLPVGLA